MATKAERQSMLDLLAPYAYALQQASGIPASLTLAQWAEETGWKLKTLGNNLFGVKASKNWKGDVFTAPTTEEIGGKRVPQMGTFRKYDSILDAFKDRFSFLSTEKYAGVRQSDPFKGADALQSAGYATNSSYASNLKSIIRSNDLTRYDNPSPITLALWKEKTGSLDMGTMTSTSGGGLELVKDGGDKKGFWDGIGFWGWGDYIPDSWKDKAAQIPGMPGSGNSLLGYFQDAFKQVMFVALGIAGVYLGFKLIMKGEPEE